MEGLDPNQLSDRELLLLIFEEQRKMGERVGSHGKRLTTLERWRDGMLWGAAAIATAYKALTVINGHG